jgi:hypothetical protein
VVALTASYFANQDNGDAPPLREVLYWPLVLAQIAAMLFAVAMTANTVAIERQKGTWDSLKMSLSGVSMTLRARWAAVFFRLGWLLLVISLGRAAYIGLLLDDLVEFQGRALDLRISGITPQVSLDLAVILMAALMTAFILEPFVAVALASAIGLGVSVLTRTRSIVILGLLLLIGVRLAITMAAIVAGGTVFEGDLGVTTELAELSDTQAGYRLVFASSEGDMMLKLLNLDTLGQVWADVHYAIYIGAALLGVVLVQALIANVLVLLAAWWAARPSDV